MSTFPPAIWAASDGEKIDRDHIGHALSHGNSVWDGQRIKLFGARNEIIAFQVIVEAPNDGIHSLSASLHELTHENGAAITYAPPSKDPSDYVGRPIQLFAVRYMNVLEPTSARWLYRNTNHDAHSHRIGWKPVQLVPENASQDGFPLTVPSGHVQAIWIEIYLGRDLPAGSYLGSINVVVDGTTASVPVELELFDFSLPDVNSLPAMIYYQPAQPELYHGRNLDTVYHRFAHRHRIELVRGYGGSEFAAFGRFRGDDFTRAFGYEGPGEGVGNTIAPFSFYFPGPAFDERTSAWRTSDEWMSFIESSLPDAITFLYLHDEPTAEQFALIRQIAENIKSNPGPGSRLPLLATRHYTAELDGAIDIWDSPAPQYNIQHAEEERARGRDHWVCNGGRPTAGAVVIDSPATDARMMPWACFKHGIKVYFYWHSVHWRHNHQKVGDRIQNVWANSITFDNRGEPGKAAESQGFGNGDGVLMYPGEDMLHPAEDRGIAGPISTIQLANLRRGLQDHLYLTLAQRCGLVAEVGDALQAVVPSVFSDANGTIGFAEDGDAYETARYDLAVAIAAASR